MQKNKIILASMLAMIGTSAMAQGSAKGTMEASAKIESFCQINAADINFGVVSLPLTAQSANSQMNILCSNNMPYKVDLSYGGSYVGESSNVGTLGVEGITSSMAYQYTDYYYQTQGLKSSGYRLYQNGQPVGSGYYSDSKSNITVNFNLNGDNNWGDIACATNNPNYIYIRSYEAAQLLNKNNIYGTWTSDTYGLCDNSKGILNQTNFTKLFGSAVSDKGVMTGTFKGDKLAYQITLPSDSTKPWVAGINSYNATGVGSNQVIEVNAKIVPSASSSSYIAADTYLDTVVATVIY